MAVCYWSEFDVKLKGTEYVTSNTTTPSAPPKPWSYYESVSKKWSPPTKKRAGHRKGDYVYDRLAGVKKVDYRAARAAKRREVKRQQKISLKARKAQCRAFAKRSRSR